MIQTLWSLVQVALVMSGKFKGGSACVKGAVDRKLLAVSCCFHSSLCAKLG